MKTSNVQPAFAQGYGGQASLRLAPRCFVL